MASDLFISAWAPTTGSGRALRLYTLVRALAALGPLDMAYVPFEGDGPDDMFAAIDGVTYHRITPSRGLRRMRTYAERRVAGYQGAVARGASPELLEAAERLTVVPGRGRVIAGDMSVMCVLMGFARRHPVIFNTHNIESAPGHDPLRGRPTWLPMAITERRIMHRAVESWIVSPSDLELAASLAPGARLRLAPNVVDVANIPARENLGAGRTILMVADFTYERNADALALLLDEILPVLWTLVPDARVRLVGRGLEDHPPMDPRVDRVGFVDALGPAYADATVVVVPIVAGGGTSLKFLEAMAYGVPVVSTVRGARGLPVVPGEHYLEADDPAAFAAAVAGVLRDGAPELARAARELVERDFSVEALARLLDPAVPATDAVPA